MIETKYCCDYCQFSTTIKKEAEKHRKSKQHTINENKIEDFLEMTTLYICMSCDKSYNKYKSCWEHSKRCRKKCLQKKATHSDENILFEIVEKSTLEEPNTNNFDKTVGVFETIIEKNTSMMESLMEKMITVMEKMTETMANGKNNTNYTNNNSNNNNHYTINMFLNEKCKDAVNITDWVNGLVIDFEHLYYNAENGFQKGLTKMMIDNLKLYNVYKRPIHFTDVKRDTMYIKDADEWTKHENNEKLIEVLESSARQGINCFADWMGENAPAYHDLDSQLGQQYMAIHQNVIRPERERKKAYPKVMKEVAREAKLRKEDQT
jgi:hypothetical protein